MAEWARAVVRRSEVWFTAGLWFPCWVAGQLLPVLQFHRALSSLTGGSSKILKVLLIGFQKSFFVIFKVGADPGVGGSSEAWRSQVKVCSLTFFSHLLNLGSVEQQDV